MQSSSRDAAAAEMKRIVGYSGRRGLGRGGKVETFFFAYIFFSVVFVFSNETRERERGGSRRGETNFFSLSEFFFISFASFPRAEAATLPPPPVALRAWKKSRLGGALLGARRFRSVNSVLAFLISLQKTPPQKNSLLSLLSLQLFTTPPRPGTEPASPRPRPGPWPPSCGGRRSGSRARCRARRRGGSCEEFFFFFFL